MVARAKGQHFKKAIKVGMMSIGHLLMGGLTLIWIARELGPAGYGRLTFALTVVNFLAIPFGVALNNFIVRKTVKFHDGRNTGIGAIKLFATKAFWLSWGYSIVALLIIWLGQRSPINELLSVAIFFIPFVCMLSLQGGILRGNGFTIYGQSLIWFWQPLIYIFLLYIVSTDRKLSEIEVVCAGLAAYFLAATLGLYKVRVSIKGLIHASSKCFPAEWVVICARFVLVAGLVVANANASTLYLGSFSSSDQVGYYSVAGNLALLASVPLGVFNVVLAAPIARVCCSKNKMQLQKLAQWSSRAAFALSIIIVAFMIYFGRPLIEFLFGASYKNSYLPMVILLIGHIFNVMCGSVMLILAMTGHERDSCQILAGAVVLNVLLCIFLVEPLGSVGAAIASAISMVFWNVLMTISVRLRLGVNSFVI